MFRRPHRRIAGYALALAGAAALVVFAAAPGQASDQPTRYNQVNQVSDLAGMANLQDTDVVNAWGLALSPTSPLWVANNGTNTATLYRGGVGGAPVTKAPLTVTIPGGAPTGQAFNNTPDFPVTNAAGKTAPATFMFVSEGGDVTAWSNQVSGTQASVMAHVDGAVFKGLALVHTANGPFLVVTDFVGGHIDVFDQNFNKVTLPSNVFNDPNLPSNYAPFGVLAAGDHVFVTYAKQQAGSADEAHGPGLGVVDEYSDFGMTVQRIATHGTLNAPWGLAIAPDGFGTFAGALLVGNFGDGHIGAWRDGEFLGQLRDPSSRRIVIDGLWALLPGTANTGGVGTIWFSAGPNDESDGLVGQLIPNS